MPVSDRRRWTACSSRRCWPTARDNFWFGGNQGLIVRSPDGKIRSSRERDGLPDIFVRALWEDRDGNMWAGTNAGIARLDGDRFVAPHDGGPDTRHGALPLRGSRGQPVGRLEQRAEPLRDDIFTRLREERRAAQRRAEYGVPGSRRAASGWASTMPA